MRKSCHVGASVIAVLAVLAGVPAAGAADKSKAATPLVATHSFEFTVAVTGSGNSTTSPLGLKTNGVFKSPGSQDCTAEASLGLLKISQQYVVIGKKVWVDQGNGLRPAKKGDFDFANVCPSDPSFWTNFAVNVPDSVTGTRENHNGIDTDKLDLSTSVHDLAGLGIFDDGFPADVTFQTLEAWRARKGGYIAALNLTLTASTDATCAEALGDTIPVALTAPCSFTVSYELSNVNSKKLNVTAPKVKK